MKVCVWDLEGPLSYIDFAAEICKLLENKLKRENLADFFNMISNYDDYLIENPNIIHQMGIESYEPGDTLRLLAPIYIHYFSDEEMKKISKSNPGLNPGIKNAISFIRKNDWDIFIISTSYTQHALNIGKLLEIKQNNIYCTKLDIKGLKAQIKNLDNSIIRLIDQIFGNYIKKNVNLESVIDDLNNFFWNNKESDYFKVMNQVFVRGGKRKENALEEVSRRTNCPISNMIVTGDSITDKDMLKRARNEDGFSISWNGNEHSLANANIAVTSPNSMGILLIFNAYPDIWEFIEKWEKFYEDFKDAPKKIPDNLIPREIKKYFIVHNFIPIIHNLKKLSSNELEQVIKIQKNMRKKIRGWVGNLG